MVILYFSGYRCLRKKSLSTNLRWMSLLTPAPPMSMLPKISKPWLYINRLFFRLAVALPEDRICQHWNWGWGECGGGIFGRQAFISQTPESDFYLKRYFLFVFCDWGTCSRQLPLNPNTAIRYNWFGICFMPITWRMAQGMTYKVVLQAFVHSWPQETISLGCSTIPLPWVNLGWPWWSTLSQPWVDPGSPRAHQGLTCPCSWYVTLMVM